jgi:hypothetical protein
VLRIACVVVTLLSAGSISEAQVITCNDRGCSDTAPGVSRARGAVSTPSRFIGGRLKCAINVNAALAAMGIQGTGSAMAKSFLNWGRPSGPVPGAVAVYDRKGRGKGHVAIVSRVEGGTVYVLNPGRGGWREVPYRKQAIAYRVAS